jgi:hypothetical protein
MANFVDLNKNLDFEKVKKQANLYDLHKISTPFKN